MDATSLRVLIKSTLTPLGLYSADAEELLMATCAQESLLGKYRVQGGGGPALGIFQMEPDTFQDIFTNYLGYHSALYTKVAQLFANPFPPDISELVNNDVAAIAMARVLYLRTPDTLPSATDLSGLWRMYKKWYNSPLGAATQAEFIQHYKLTGGSAT